MPAAPAGTSPPACQTAGWRRAPAPPGEGGTGCWRRPSGPPAHPTFAIWWAVIGCQSQQVPGTSTGRLLTWLTASPWHAAVPSEQQVTAGHAAMRCPSISIALPSACREHGRTLLLGCRFVVDSCVTITITKLEISTHRQLVPGQVHGPQLGEAGKQVAGEGAPHVPACRGKGHERETRVGSQRRPGVKERVDTPKIVC